jgi:hypothetical protein
VALLLDVKVAGGAPPLPPSVGRHIRDFLVKGWRSDTIFFGKEERCSLTPDEECYNRKFIGPKLTPDGQRYHQSRGWASKEDNSGSKEGRERAGRALEADQGEMLTNGERGVMGDGEETLPQQISFLSEVSD